MTMTIAKSIRVRAMAVALATVTLGGCGGIDGVELNGGVFDLMGVGTNSVRAKEPVVPQRTGLVLPPQREVLPAPGSGVDAVAVAANPAWPVDPEERKRQQTVVAQKQHEAYCAQTMQRKRALGDDSSTQGPLGRCDPSILKWIGSTGEVREMREPGS